MSARGKCVLDGAVVKNKKSAREVGCAERVVRGSSGEVNEVTPGWERVRVQIESGAIDTVGPKGVVRALELKEGASDVEAWSRFCSCERGQRRGLRKE